MSEQESRDALRERLGALEDQVNTLETRVSPAVDRDIPLLKGTLRSIVGGDIHSLDDLPQAARTFHDRREQRDARLRAIETQLDALSNIDGDSSTKHEKYRAVLAFAQNKRSTSSKVTVSPSEIQGCTGVSRRYAYDLLENIAEDVDGACLRQSKQIDTGSGTKQKPKALLVDCETIHTDDDTVNNFTTDGGDQDRT